jgi:hypothetical protein
MRKRHGRDRQPQRNPRESQAVSMQRYPDLGVRCIGRSRNARTAPALDANIIARREISGMSGATDLYTRGPVHGPPRSFRTAGVIRVS